LLLHRPMADPMTSLVGSLKNVYASAPRSSMLIGIAPRRP
jgi:hypothetical protein